MDSLVKCSLCGKKFDLAFVRVERSESFVSVTCPFCGFVSLDTIDMFKVGVGVGDEAVSKTGVQPIIVENKKKTVVSFWPLLDVVWLVAVVVLIVMGHSGWATVLFVVPFVVVLFVFFLMVAIVGLD